MEKLRNTILIASLVLVGLTIPVRAEMATTAQALTVANNWINLIIQKKGDWGGAKSAVVEEVKEFKRGKRVVGYFCRVKPKGFIVVSLRKELAAVKAYSATCDLDPECDEGLTDVIKLGMERVLNMIEKQFGPIKAARTEDLIGILEINYRPAWDELSGDVEIFKAGLKSGMRTMNYAGGDPPLLSSSWHQRDPYNVLCPTGDIGCPDCCPTETGRCPPSDPTPVGCVATAGAQIMRYWSWPSHGSKNASHNWHGDYSCPAHGIPGEGAQNLEETLTDAYDWRRIANQYVWDAWNNRWEDEDGNSLTQANVDAVAELCYEVGVAVEMDYGVCGSGASHYNMRDAYKDHFRYSTAVGIVKRKSYTSGVNWFNDMKAQFNANRPVHYGIEGHSLVADGWQEIYIGGDFTRQYHMNYGWAGGNTGEPCWTGIPNSNTWYTLDELPCSDLNAHDMIRNIYPGPSLGKVLLSGLYSRPSFPYRYFDQDCTNYYLVPTATFAAGQNLQFLPGVKVECIGIIPGTKIGFEGTSSQNTRLFSIKGTQSAGIKIYDGAIELYPGGGLRFH
ncbi:MAG: C10 family peptidase [Desulfobacteraceae bacterium]|nr:C10 family peptidase [Desulfobacteraceae bacterium]